MNVWACKHQMHSWGMCWGCYGSPWQGAQHWEVSCQFWTRAEAVPYDIAALCIVS
jgi:hypothetical protein